MTAEHPEGWRPTNGQGDAVADDEVREALAAVAAEADQRGSNYAAGMRHARAIIEEELLTETD